MDKSLSGKLLIASPYLPDQNFFQTVCFMVRHDEEGAFGLILNRPSNLSLRDVLEETIGNVPIRDDAIFLGGPVEGPLCALHSDGNYADLECEHGLFVTSDQESIAAIANQPQMEVRFFAGYSGWSGGQLESELDLGGWLVADASLEDLFGDANSMWEDIVKRVGRSVIEGIVPAASSGFDPSLN